MSRKPFWIVNLRSARGSASIGGFPTRVSADRYADNLRPHFQEVEVWSGYHATCIADPSVIAQFVRVGDR